VLCQHLVYVRPRPPRPAAAHPTPPLDRHKPDMLRAAFFGSLLLAVRSQDIIPDFGCDFGGLQAKMDKVELQCCGQDNCPGGVPSHCSVACAIVYTPFYRRCKSLIAHIFVGSKKNEVSHFDKLSRACTHEVDLGEALDIVQQLRSDDSSLLVPGLDGFETYRHMDPQHDATGTFDAGLCADWQGAATPATPAGSRCCEKGTGSFGGQGICGPRCPGWEALECRVNKGAGTCPKPPVDGAFQVVTKCTQTPANMIAGPRGHGSYHICSPRDCAAACKAAQGCTAFRYNAYAEGYADGTTVREQCRNGPRAEAAKSYCEFSHKCTTTKHPPAASAAGHPSDVLGRPVSIVQWHTYVKRDGDDKH
jgi:hypothetical protein